MWGVRIRDATNYNKIAHYCNWSRKVSCEQ
jgi:hypothetical protein